MRSGFLWGLVRKEVHVNHKQANAAVEILEGSGLVNAESDRDRLGVEFLHIQVKMVYGILIRHGFSLV